MSLIDEYLPKSDVDPDVAIPKVWEYREKFAQRKLSGRDVTTQAPAIDASKFRDSEMDRFGSLAVGDGLSVE